MITTYTELVDSIADELARQDLAGIIPTWIQQAEIFICRECAVPDGEAALNGNFVPGQAILSMPAGFKKAIHFEIQSDPIRILEQVDWTKRSDVLENDTGRLPRAYTFLGRDMYLAPVPQGTESYTLIYYGKPTPLSAANPSNEILSLGPDALRYQALTYSAPYLGEDERIQTWSALAAQAIRSLRNEFWDGDLGAGVMRIRPDFAPSDAHR